jgi:hydrogenase maturation protease
VLTLVVGVGNAWRGDDAAGLAVARRVRALAPAVEVCELDGDVSALVGLLDGREGVAVVDAARWGAPPGTVHAIRADREPLPAGLGSSTHAFGVADAIELARALGRLPVRLDVYGVEGEDFATGAPLSPAVAAGVEALAVRLAG